LAHSILRPFETRFCIQPGTVTAYRVYQAVGQPKGIQVRVVEASRLSLLAAALMDQRNHDAAHGVG
jgi:hypothetical protein